MSDPAQRGESGAAPPPRRAAADASDRWPWLALVAAVIGWSWSGLFAVDFTGEDYALMARARGGLAASEHVFRPLADLWVWTLHALFGAEQPLPWHAATLALHLANAGLVAALAQGLGLSRTSALAAALVFGLGAGVADALAWVSALNRPLSAFGCLLALNGLVRLEREGGRALAVFALGFALQFLANEEVYGTSALALAWLIARALRGGRAPFAAPRAACVLAALGVAAAIAIHALLLRGGTGGYLLRDGSAWSALARAPANALARLDALGLGLGLSPWEGRLLLLAAFASLLAAGAARAALFGALALGASFVPYALEPGAHYRDYPSQAPLALLLAGGVFEALARFAPAARALARAALLALFAGAVLWSSHAPRRAQLGAWTAATRELAGCRPGAFALAASGAPAPILANLEISTRGLFAYAFRQDDLSSLRALHFLDAPSGRVVPADLAARIRPGDQLFGRRCDGSFGPLGGASYFESGARLEPVRLYARARGAGSLDEALALLATGAVDLAQEAVVEAPADSPGGAPAGAPASAMLELERMRLGPYGRPAEAELEILAPVAIAPGAAGLLEARASGRFRVRTSAPVLLVVQEPWMYGEELRTAPDYALLWRMRERRALSAEASLDGAGALPCWRANVFGTAVIVPEGEHELALRWSVAPEPRGR